MDVPNTQDAVITFEKLIVFDKCDFSELTSVYYARHYVTLNFTKKHFFENQEIVLTFL